MCNEISWPEAFVAVSAMVAFCFCAYHFFKFIVHD